MRIPTDQEMRDIHAKFAPTSEAFELVYTHCQIVCQIAEQLLSRQRRPDLNCDLVRAGCLLHDIGVYQLYGPSGDLDHSRYVTHGVLGAKLLAELGFPARLCRFCSCHTGMGLTRDDVLQRKLPIPPGDYLAASGEEELVMFADKFHSKTDPPAFLTSRTAAESLARFGKDKEEAFTAMLQRFGEPDLTHLQTRYGHRII